MWHLTKNKAFRLCPNTGGRGGRRRLRGPGAAGRGPQ